MSENPYLDSSLREVLEVLFDFRLYVSSNVLSWRRGALPIVNPMGARVDEILARYGMPPSHRYKKDNSRYHLT